MNGVNEWMNEWTNDQERWEKEWTTYKRKIGVKEKYRAKTKEETKHKKEGGPEWKDKVWWNGVIKANEGRAERWTEILNGKFLFAINQTDIYNYFSLWGIFQPSLMVKISLSKKYTGVFFFLYATTSIRLWLNFAFIKARLDVDFQQQCLQERLEMDFRMYTSHKEWSEII